MLFRLATIWFCSVLYVSGASAFELQGHRGARGLMPENTLPAFAMALSIGVSTLELDLAVTADKSVVVSHNPALDPDMTRNAAGVWIEKQLLINSLNFEELQTFDVGRIRPGSRAASRFPEQQGVDGTSMPSLEDVFDLVERAGNNSVRFNIETKISPLEPQDTVDAGTFAALVLALVKARGLEDRVSIQSFDWRTLQAVQTEAPELETVYLTAQQDWLDNVQSTAGKASPWTAEFNLDDYSGNLPQMVKAAGGDVWSPFFGNVSPALVKQAQALGLKVIPWTVNDAAMMETLIEAGVDGLITDFPDRLRAVMQARGMALPPATPVEP
uniref:glycerophosphodiester phosphodiesterase n=1 Tax=Pararhizobium sp. IMCC3301 TaxID=3067904 RepID=UPI002741837B|nr:glycerophosphodiester phosphodiesterase [Pararhizobium sp. IMCC3301]